jgi:hypothetical protein
MCIFMLRSLKWQPMPALPIKAIFGRRGATRTRSGSAWPPTRQRCPRVWPSWRGAGGSAPPWSMTRPRNELYLEAYEYPVTEGFPSSIMPSYQVRGSRSSRWIYDLDAIDTGLRLDSALTRPVRASVVRRKWKPSTYELRISPIPPRRRQWHRAQRRVLQRVDSNGSPSKSRSRNFSPRRHPSRQRPRRGSPVLAT